MLFLGRGACVFMATAELEFVFLEKTRFLLLGGKGMLCFLAALRVGEHTSRFLGGSGVLGKYKKTALFCNLYGFLNKVL